MGFFSLSLSVFLAAMKRSNLIKKKRIRRFFFFFIWYIIIYKIKSFEIINNEIVCNMYCSCVNKYKESGSSRLCRSVFFSCCCCCNPSCITRVLMTTQTLFQVFCNKSESSVAVQVAPAKSWWPKIFLKLIYSFFSNFQFQFWSIIERFFGNWLVMYRRLSLPKISNPFA